MLNKNSHISVLHQEVLDQLITPEIKTVFDGTLGLGGHAELILTKFPQITHYIGTDLDEQHLAFVKERLKKFPAKKSLFHRNFSTINTCIEESSPQRALAILIDLGLCSNQIDDAQKGFSFIQNGPLHMAFSSTSSRTAEKIINNYTHNQLTRIFKDYGEERFSSKIAKKIIERREEQPFKTTQELKDLIESITHFKMQKKTLMRIFQAIRIEVNQELEHLEKVMHDATSLMQKGDRIGIMSFHSLEDRMVKKFFRKLSTHKTTKTLQDLHHITEHAPFKLLTKSPLTPNKKELQENPRSRSVKFRIIEKI